MITKWPFVGFFDRLAMIPALFGLQKVQDFQIKSAIGEGNYRLRTLAPFPHLIANDFFLLQLCLKRLLRYNISDSNKLFPVSPMSTPNIHRISMKRRPNKHNTCTQTCAQLGQLTHKKMLPRGVMGRGLWFRGAEEDFFRFFFHEKGVKPELLTKRFLFRCPVPNLAGK
jgi:hypothetical protein